MTRFYVASIRYPEPAVWASTLVASARCPRVGSAIVEPAGHRAAITYIVEDGLLIRSADPHLRNCTIADCGYLAVYARPSGGVTVGGVLGQVTALGEVLPQQSVGVLVRAA